MAKIPLVEMQIQDGQLLLDRLTREGVAVTAACWVNESESGDWYLYLVTPLVSADGSKKSAYRRVNTVIRAMQQEGIWIEVDKKVIRPDDPIAKDIVAYRDRLPVRRPRWFREGRLGDLAVEAAYIYPLTANPDEAAGVSKR
jgi:hypothetical protein